MLAHRGAGASDWPARVLAAMSIADPLRQLRWALGEVQRGNYNAHMQIYDASELGLLQAGLQRHGARSVRAAAAARPVRPLRRRGRRPPCAGARHRARRPGARRRGAVRRPGRLDPAGRDPTARRGRRACSTSSSGWSSRPSSKHGGFVNKFQGDAALAIFGAPIEHPDASGAALAAARELHDELLAGARRRPSSASGCRPAGRSPATSARRPASSTP